MAPVEPYRAAHALVEQYGADAVSLAARRARAFYEQKDFDGAAIWLAVARAVLDIQSTKRKGPLH